MRLWMVKGLLGGLVLKEDEIRKTGGYPLNGNRSGVGSVGSVGRSDSLDGNKCPPKARKGRTSTLAKLTMSEVVTIPAVDVSEGSRCKGSRQDYSLIPSGQDGIARIFASYYKRNGTGGTGIGNDA